MVDKLIIPSVELFIPMVAQYQQRANDQVQQEIYQRNPELLGFEQAQINPQIEQQVLQAEEIKNQEPINQQQQERVNINNLQQLENINNLDEAQPLINNEIQQVVQDEQQQQDILPQVNSIIQTLIQQGYEYRNVLSNIGQIIMIIYDKYQIDKYKKELSKYQFVYNPYDNRPQTKQLLDFTESYELPKQCQRIFTTDQYGNLQSIVQCDFKGEQKIYYNI